MFLTFFGFEFDSSDFSHIKLILSPSKVIEIPDESEKSPDVEKKEEVDTAGGKEEKEMEAGNGDGGKEKEVEDMSKEKEEKTTEAEKETPAEVKGEGSDGKNNEGEECF